MCKSLQIIIIIIVLNVQAELDMVPINPDAYGPYTIMWRSYELCNGPKSTNLTYITKSMLVEKDVYIGVMNISFPGNARIEQIKISAAVVKNSKKNLLWNYKIDKPCQHYALSKILKQYLEMDNSCVVKKKDYHLIVNFTETTYTFLGNSFFYGEFIFKTIIISKKGNIGCISLNPVISKKK